MGHDMGMKNPAFRYAMIFLVMPISGVSCALLEIYNRHHYMINMLPISAGVAIGLVYEILVFKKSPRYFVLGVAFAIIGAIVGWRLVLTSGLDFRYLEAMGWTSFTEVDSDIPESVQCKRLDASSGNGTL